MKYSIFTLVMEVKEIRKMIRGFKNVLLFIGFFAWSAVMLSACASGSAGMTGTVEDSSTESFDAESEETSDSNPTGASEHVSVGTTASADSAESPEPSYGGSVTVAIAQDLDGLDPHTATSAGTEEVLFNIFEGLVKATPDGDLAPAVASDYEISEDGRAYTFTLRDGVTFHNGETVTAQDVIYSLERCAGSENDGTPLVTAFSDIESISSPDENHVVLTLTTPNLEFIYSMTAAIIPEGSGESMASHPIGTGPFSFVSYNPQESMTVEKYDGYWGDEPYLDEVTFRIITDSNTRITGLRSGALDMAIHLPNTYLGDVSDDFNVDMDTMKLVQALYLNNSVEPLDDVRIRQAIYYAVDVDEIIDFVCDGAGVATGTSMYPAFTKYFLPELAETYSQDLGRSRELLIEAGYPDGFSLTITVPGNYDQHVQTAEVLEQQLGEVGIEVSIEEVEWATWVSDIYHGRNFMSTVCGIAADDMTAHEMLSRYATDDRKNFINFSNEEYDQLIARATASLDDGEQTELYKEAERILNEEAASIWIQDLCDLVVYNKALSGVTFYRTYILDMSKIYYIQ